MLNYRLYFCCSMDLLTCENVTNEANREGVQSNNILQVLKDMSRKRNYTQVGFCVLSSYYLRYRIV